MAPQGFGRLDYTCYLAADGARIAMMPCRLHEEGARAHAMTKRFNLTRQIAVLSNLADVALRTSPGSPPPPTKQPIQYACLGGGAGEKYLCDGAILGEETTEYAILFASRTGLDVKLDGSNFRTSVVDRGAFSVQENQEVRISLQWTGGSDRLILIGIIRGV